MTIYEVNHIHADCEDVKCIGFFSTLDNVYNTIERLRTAPGFCLTKDGFYIVRHTLKSEKRLEKIYRASVYFHTSDYEMEYEELLGLYSTEEAAKAALQQYQTDNPTPVPEMTTKFLTNCYQLDQPEWVEGFDSYAYEP